MTGNKNKSALKIIAKMGGIFSILFFVPILAEDTLKTPTPQVIKYEKGKTDYVRLLGGPPESFGMRSGLVSLQPGQSVGKHNTEEYEELLIVLQGQGEMQIAGGKTLNLTINSAAYCPPHTEHNVLNTSKEPLYYIYVVAKTGK